MGIFDKLFGKKSKDSEVKDAGIEKGEVKKKRTVKPKKKLEKTEDAKDVPSLLEILKRSRIIGASIFDQYGALDKIVEIGAPAVEPLIEALKRDEDEVARWVAADALGTIGDNRAVEPLIEALKNDVHPDVQWHAAESLGRLRDDRAVEFLADALKDEDSMVREFAKKALKEIKAKKSIKKKPKKKSTVKPNIVKRLIQAAEEGDIAKITTLLTQGADVNARSEIGWTALIAAAEEGHTEIVEMLLTKGADVNAESENDCTALMLAASNGHTEIVRLLKQAGAKG